jgi:hypothetical protein
MEPDAPYSPNLAPSDFFLFGHVNYELDGAEFPSEEDLWPQFSQQFGMSQLTDEGRFPQFG